MSLTIVRKNLDELHMDPANARIHGERNLQAISDSIASFGQVEPLVVQKSTGKVIGGNGRLEVMRRNGIKEADVVEIDIDNTKATALGIALNRSASLGEWDNETLATLLNNLNEHGDIGLTGFDESELQALLDELTPKEVVEDEAPEPPANPVSRTGDLWLCGEHRVLCGDSTDKGCVDALLAGRKPFIMVTDPPYGVEYDPQWRQDAAEAGHLAEARRRVGKVANDDRVDWTDAYRLFMGTVGYVWHASAKIDVAINLRDAGLGIRTQIIWRKPAFCISRGHYHWQHEAAWYVVRNNAGSSKWCGDRSQSTVWDITPGKGDRGDIGHGTQKPIECMARPIRNHGGADDDVYDPFLGSGTTLIAAEQLGRRCYGIEISPQYVDVIVTRWQNLTGKQATLEGDGRTFQEIQEERLTEPATV